jgi:hypothetical protein
MKTMRPRLWSESVNFCRCLSEKSSSHLMGLVEVPADLGVNAEAKGDDDEDASERVEGNMTWVPGRATEEASDDDGDGRKEDESKRGADG